jgi:hypothetical protein
LSIKDIQQILKRIEDRKNRLKYEKQKGYEIMSAEMREKLEAIIHEKSPE